MFGDEKKEIYGAETYYRELGHFQIHRAQFHESFPAFNKAIEVVPTDLRSLIGRSWARAKATYFHCAVDDMNKAIKAYPDDLRPVQLKALYTFLRTNFEDSFVQNQRGSYLRKKPDMFLIGAMHCHEVVERCIGKRGGPCLRDHYDIIRTIAWKKAIDLRMGKQWKPRFKKRKRKPKKVDNTPPLYTNFMKKMKHLNLYGADSEISILESLTDEREKKLDIIYQPKSDYQPPQRRTSNIDNLLTERYLHRMCYDKHCLKNLKTDPRINGPNYDGVLYLRMLAKKAYTSVSYRQEVLRARQPFYSVKYNEPHSKGNLLRRQLDELEKMQNVAAHDAEALLKLLKDTRERGFTLICEKIADTTKAFIDKKPLKILPSKEVYLRDLYETMSYVYLDNLRLKDVPDFNAIKRINFLFGLPISREPSQDSIIKNNKKEFMSIKKAIRVAEARLANATTPLETVYLYHELAKQNMEIKKFDLSRFYARKAINMSKVLNNNVWTIVINMLITTTFVRQRNRNEAKNELTKTIEFATPLKNKNLNNYLKKCYDVIETLDFDVLSSKKVLEDREKLMLDNIQHRDVRRNLDNLFIRMDAIPPFRRLSIMPGLYMDVKKRKAPCKATIKPLSAAEVEYQAGLTIKTGLDLLEVD